MLQRLPALSFSLSLSLSLSLCHFLSFFFSLRLSGREGLIIMSTRVERARRYIVEILTNKKKEYIYICVCVCVCVCVYVKIIIIQLRFRAASMIKKRRYKFGALTSTLREHARSHQRAGHIRDSFIDRKTRPFGL